MTERAHPRRCADLRHVRTGAADDPPLHLPCDAERIAALVFRASAREVAAALGVTRRTVVRWRRRLRSAHPG